MQTNYTYVASYSKCANTIYNNTRALMCMLVILMYIPVIDSEFCLVIDYALSFKFTCHNTSRFWFPLNAVVMF